MLDHASIIAFAACFFIGSIPFGLIVARAFKVNDLTSRGSGNIGATNVSRVLGFWPAGFLTLLLDFAKGAAPVYLMMSGALAPDRPFSVIEVWIAALLAVVGHCYSPWLRFKGGKGVATGFGVLVALAPLSAACGVIGFGVAFAMTRIGSLSSLTGLACATIACLVAGGYGPHLWLGAALVLLILIRHEGNLDAILESREKTFR
jgi:glycerol-3-phosphate acyltransferase PlsY